MFKCLQKYFRLRNIEYFGEGAEHHIRWPYDPNCLSFCEGWSINELDFSEDEVLSDEEWVDIQFRIPGIENDPLFEEKLQEAKRVLDRISSDDIKLEGRFEDNHIEGTVLLSDFLCLSYSKPGPEVELDVLFKEMAELIQETMSRYQDEYLGTGRDMSRYSEDELKAFVSQNLPLSCIDATGASAL